MPSSNESLLKALVGGSSAAVERQTTKEKVEPPHHAGKKRRLNEGTTITFTHSTGVTSYHEKRKVRLDRMVNPNDFVIATFKEHGCGTTVQKSTLADYFHVPTEAEIDAYEQDVVQAVRSQNIALLRDMHSKGRCLQCCNRFGEGLMHMACRRGFVDVVKFLVLEAKCPLYVRDDYGRTPMHDACWSPRPNFGLVLFLIQHAPKLLLLSDVRGHTPFSYVRKEHWQEWVLFLREHRELLQPDRDVICERVDSPLAAVG